MRLRFHVSIAGGLDRCLQRTTIRRCTTVQIFTAAPVQWARTPFSEDHAQAFADELATRDIRPHFVHAKYLLNVSSPDAGLRERSVADLCGLRPQAVAVLPLSRLRRSRQGEGSEVCDANSEG